MPKFNRRALLIAAAGAAAGLETIQTAAGAGQESSGSPSGEVWPASVPWWDRFPGIVQTGDAAIIAKSHATASLTGIADDPCWGIFAQRQRIIESGRLVPDLHREGVKVMVWFEGFGSAGSAYIVEVRLNPDGSYVRIARHPDMTRLFLNHWSWEKFHGAGVIRWVGIHNYFDNEDFVRPYTRTHPRYGCGPMIYPDGRVATGYADPADPRTSRIFDAGCSKDVLGRLAIDYDYNDVVNRLDPATGKPHGPLTGLLLTPDPPPTVPDPGFTPEQWAKMKRPRYSGSFGPGKDSACPVWTDYVRASIRQALDAGVDGLWVDNFSPWDSFNAVPIAKAFGDWSVARFRNYLDTNLGPELLATLHISDPYRFDVRDYLRKRCAALGGNPAHLDDERWRHPSWQDDPIWRAYLIHKRQTGTRALSLYYHAVKEEASRFGKPDLLVSGNDIPIFALGWPRGDLDMVSCEMTWGWHLTTGPRGLMPPPYGSYVPVYKLAREHARGRFVNAWMYVPEEQKKKPNIARVLYYQALANHAGPMPQYYGNTAGTADANAEFMEFMKETAPVWGMREPIEEIGIYSSSSTQLMEMLPGGFKNHADQPHSFSFWGWGTALTFLHRNWRAVPEWKLTAHHLAGLRALILPGCEVFPEEDLAVLDAWVRAGGGLVIAGQCGLRYGESGNFERLAKGSTLDPLLRDAASDGAGALRLGAGRILTLREDPGRPFYADDHGRPDRLPAIGKLLGTVLPPNTLAAIDAPDVPWSVGLTPYRDRARLFVDVNNNAIDLATDIITPTPTLTFSLPLPPELVGKPLKARAFAPDGALSVKLEPAPGGRISITSDPVTVYASLLIEPEA
jgi:hypothetical protein